MDHQVTRPLDHSLPLKPSWFRRCMRFMGNVATVVLLLALIATTSAHVLRDRMLGLALLMFVPIWPLALMAILRDVLACGRALPLRWLLLGIGLASGVFYGSLLWCKARAPEGNTESPGPTIAQWNVQWGGPRGPESLLQMVTALEGYQPDVICLSEAPKTEHIKSALEQAGASGWHIASVEHAPNRTYWFRLTVLSRAPVSLRREWDLSSGHAALFEVGMKPRTLRLLMVDLQSAPHIPRSPTLVEVAGIVSELAATNTLVDVVAGDFNTPGSFLGFDALSEAAGGYRRAALWSGQWRATWPARMWLSPLDIDHLWVSRGLNIASAQLFSSPGSDHRGQVAALRFPSEAD